MGIVQSRYEVSMMYGRKTSSVPSMFQSLPLLKSLSNAIVLKIVIGLARGPQSYIRKSYSVAEWESLLNYECLY